MKHNSPKDIAADNSSPNRKALRPQDAATLLILDRRNTGEPHVLMGKRHMGHKFMPGKFVFPGGRVDTSDSRIQPLTPYDPKVEEKLAKHPKNSPTAARVRAFAMAAIRETYEEAGLFIGKSQDQGPIPPLGEGFRAFEERSIVPSLAPMRFIARAITPPMRPRRYDTRFLSVWADEIADQLPEGTGPTGELEELQWLSLEGCKALDLPRITLTIIEELQQRLCIDPDLNPDTPVPFYYWRGVGFVRKEL
ncbi:NUDIX hydrolase [Flexibacterium corallicola]|uniref:NUDIX hydrolase n=1 Tax=Flexibacterium corallicola TaxID=3037259 RepID=UPI00286EE5DC|nr:NUDIX hydrolase [Pseudovibrio sp. M1P-2-3]